MARKYKHAYQSARTQTAFNEGKLSSYVLYLRPFVSDDEYQLEERKSFMYSYMDLFSPEEKIEKSIPSPYQFLAIGSPDESLPHLGAQRLYFNHSNWQESVQWLIENASLIIMLAGSGEFMGWELECCMKHTIPEKFILFVPVEDESGFDEFVSNTQHLFPTVRLKFHPGIVYGFSGNWQNIELYEFNTLKGFISNKLDEIYEIEHPEVW